MSTSPPSTASSSGQQPTASSDLAVPSAARAAAREHFAEAQKDLQDAITDSGRVAGGERLAATCAKYTAATVDLVLTGLDKYLIAAAKDRESAERYCESAERDRQSFVTGFETFRQAVADYVQAAANDRESAERERAARGKDRESAANDRTSQKHNRCAMVILTAVIAIATAASIWKAEKQTAPNSPVVNVQPIPVTLNPVVPVSIDRVEVRADRAQESGRHERSRTKPK